MKSSKKIVIFGASGRIGRTLTQQALRDDYEVTAFVLNQHSLKDINHKNLRIYQGDATNASDTMNAVAHHDAVISVLGHNKHTNVEMQSNAMRAIIAAMQQHKVDRIVTLTGIGVFTAQDVPTLLDKFFVSTLMFLQPKRIQDGIKHIEVLKCSDIDWVALRTPKHKNAKKAKDYNINPTIKKSSLTVSRLNIARELLHLACADTVPHRFPVISER